jgi:acyl-CoA thioester hydrolase
MFEKILYASWGDMDYNSHMRNTAYLDKSADVRMMFFAENGFPMSEFAKLRIGPVITKDEIEYFREVSLLDKIRVTLSVAGMSEDGSRWLVRNEFFRPDGKLVAKVTSMGGWLDLSARRIVRAPERLLEVFRSLTRTEDFQQLETRLK